MSTSAEKEFKEWQRQLALKAAATELKELNHVRPPTTTTRRAAGWRWRNKDVTSSRYYEAL